MSEKLKIQQRKNRYNIGNRIATVPKKREVKLQNT